MVSNGNRRPNYDHCETLNCVLRLVGWSYATTTATASRTWKTIGWSKGFILVHHTFCCIFVLPLDQLGPWNFLMRRFDDDINMRWRNCLSLNLNLYASWIKALSSEQFFCSMRISNIDLVKGVGWQGDPTFPPDPPPLPPQHPVASQLPSLLSLFPPFNPFWGLKSQAFLHNFLPSLTVLAL